MCTNKIFNAVNQRITKMKKTLILFIAYFLLLITHERLVAQNLVINEILTSNNAANTDEDGSYEDWLEIFNGTTETISLEGFGLTDNPALPFKWIFPAVAIIPGQHLLVWCSDKNRIDPTLPLHTNFKLSADGETIRLTSASGTMVDEIPPIVFPQNYSYGRSISGGPDFIVFSQPTPGFPNSEGSSTQQLTQPIFSADSGFFDAPFVLNLSHPDNEATILYTLDGSEPNPANIGGKTYPYKNQYPEFAGNPFGEFQTGSFTTYAYESPLEISDRSSLPNDVSTISTTFNFYPYYIPAQPIPKSTVVRARAYKSGYLPSTTATQNYLLSATTSLPIVALNIDEDLLFDYEKGIHVAGKDFDDWRTDNPDGNSFFSNNNYNRSGDAWEVKAHFSLFNNGQQQLSQDVGVRMHGGFTRFFPNKSFRIYARSELGSETLGYPFFGDPNQTNYKTLILRNGGNDTQSAFLRDAFIQRVVQHMNLATQAYQPAVVYLNGEYWGMFDMRERYDKHYFKRVFGIETNALDFLEYNGYLVQEGDYEHYSQMLGYLETNSLADSSTYDYIQTQMDTENFTDFFIANIFACNTDWPHNNIEFWRKKTSSYEPNAPYGQDGRWRWVLKDTDFGFGYGGFNPFNGHEHNTLAFASSVGGDQNVNPEWSTFLFRKLLENDTFKTNFINRFADMMNTTFKPERTVGILTEMKAVIASEIIKHGQRWNSIASMQQWNDSTAVIANFANLRTEFQRNHIRSKFALEANVNCTLDVSAPEHGFIKINTIDIKNTTPGVPELPYPWEGVYFKGVPVKLKAVALEGYAFSYWSGAVESSDPEITVTPNGDFSVTAHFVSTGEITDRLPVYFWALDHSLPNLSLLSTIDASFEQTFDAAMHFTSCLDGYPFAVGNPDWGKAAMAKFQSPTNINYFPDANYGIDYANAGIMGVMITQPFQWGTAENTMVLNLPTQGFKNIVVSFAAKDSNAADALVVDYSVSSGNAQWITTGLPFASLPLHSDYSLYSADFTAISSVSDNPDFKLRVRFSGENMTQMNNGRVYFNNVSVFGSPLEVMHATSFVKSEFNLYPNPFTDVVYVNHLFGKANFQLFTTDGKLLEKGELTTQIELKGLSAGLYLLHLSADGKAETKKLVKK